jgi:hypothetical protein
MFVLLEGYALKHRNRQDIPRVIRWLDFNSAHVLAQIRYRRPHAWTYLSLYVCRSMLRGRYRHAGASAHAKQQVDSPRAATPFDFRISSMREQSDVLLVGGR